jgi:hypothetical protein
MTSALPEHTLSTGSTSGLTTARTILEHLAGLENLIVARAAYRAACERWPKAVITLRQGARIVEDSRH